MISNFKGIYNFFPGRVVPALALASLLLSGAPHLAAQERQEDSTKSSKQKIVNEIDRLVMQVLQDKSKRRDPFVKTERRQQRAVITYELQTKPRPRVGLGRYDINELTLLAIWKEPDKVVVMFRAPDQKLFIAAVGDEAYDGRIVEISVDAKHVRFLQELKRVGPRMPGQPDVKYDTKYVRMGR